MTMINTGNRKSIGSVALLFLSIVFAGCSRSEDAPPADMAVPVAHVIRTDLQSGVTLTAEFQSFYEVDVMAKEAGYIRRMNVDIGDHVRNGQILATLEIPELDADLTRAKAGVQEAAAEIDVANGDLHRAQASNAISHLSYTRILDVSKKEVGLVPLQDVDVAHSRDLESQAQVFAAEQRVQAAHNHLEIADAQLVRQQALVEYTRIVAPFTGVVTRRYASDGSMIQAGTASQTQVMPVVRVSENDVLRLMLPVPEEYVGTVHDGQAVSVYVPSINQTFPGKVTRFSNDVLMSTRTMTTEVDVKNPKLQLIPGMYAQVQLNLATAPNAIAAPIEAIDGTGNNQRVFLVDSANIIRIRPVTTGLQSPQYTQLLSGSVKAGDVVIVGRHSDYHDGQKVQPRLEEPTSSSAAHS
jgi:RND family efflux transporter MFP subunit